MVIGSQLRFLHGKMEDKQSIILWKFPETKAWTHDLQFLSAEQQNTTFLSDVCCNKVHVAVNLNFPHLIWVSNRSWILWHLRYWWLEKKGADIWSQLWTSVKSYFSFRNKVLSIPNFVSLLLQDKTWRSAEVFFSESDKNELYLPWSMLRTYINGQWVSMGT